jgi:pimeloyl-ACP methyl ester carboxylesterase
LEASLFPEGIIDRLQALLDAGDPEGMLVMFYSESVGMSSEEIEQFKSSPSWPARLAAAQTLPRELRAVDQYRFDPKRFKNLKTPTLLLLGCDSPQFAKEDTETANAALPNSEIIELPGQQHIAMYTAPDLFLRELFAFLKGPSQERA